MTLHRLFDFSNKLDVDLIGSVANKVAQYAHKPVIVVR
jgi:nucleotide-binding universal stress UspA family protein